MARSNRREFLTHVGQGMLIASVGASVAADLGLVDARADDAPARLTFGRREPLVALLQETSPEHLLPALQAKLAGGVPLEELVAAAALANARVFGGDDYIGFHTFMALAPALRMARLLPAAQAPLPVFKVLYRHASRVAATDGAHRDALRPVDPAQGVATEEIGGQLRAAAQRHELGQAESLLAAAGERGAREALQDLLPLVEEGVEVHRTVLAYRGWDLLDLVGQEHAVTLLRQSVHYCVENCKPNYESRFSMIRELLPKLIEQHHLEDSAPGQRAADQGWIESLVDTLFSSPPAEAAGAVAEALAEGMQPGDVGEAISLAANRLVLCDPGRPEKWTSAGKPVGSVHGDSVGVHASDSINAWRNIAAVSGPRHAAACLILAGYQISQDQEYQPALRTMAPRHTDALEGITARSAEALLAEVNDAVRQSDQARAAAAAQHYCTGGHPAEALTASLLNFAIDNDGALHAEKYFATTIEEYGRTRPALRWRHLAGLARVMASAQGYPAPGLEEARQVLRIG